MANVDTIDITKLILVEQGSTPSSPSAGKQKLFVRSSDHLLCIVDSAGTVTPYGGALTNPMSAVGDLIRGGTAGAPTALAAVATGKVLASKGVTTAPAWDYPPFHGCKALANANTTLTTSGTEYPIAFAAADDFDSDSFHDPASNNTRMTIPSGMTGKYFVRGQTYVAATSAQYVDLKVRKNGAAGTVLAQNRLTAADGNMILEVACIAALAATDFVELYVSVNSGSKAADSSVSMFEIALLGV